jgi:NADH-quinone oxidoreductase subunit F/NADP-reducing hydrogenase subunit HndC
MLEILTRITQGKGTMQDLEDLEELAEAVKANSLCGLGQTSANPIVSTMSKFRDEYLAHIQDKKCPAHVCKNLMEYVIDKEKCTGCSMCERNCPVSTIHATDYVSPGHKQPAREIDTTKCIKCGMCQSVCRFGAVEKR